MKDLAGKTAVITGAASGVGAALARALAAQKMRLVLLDLARDGLETLAESLGGRAMRVDVADAGAMEAASAEIFAEQGAVHLLVNNAGIMPPMGPIWELPDAQMQRVLDVNVRGIVNGLRAFVPKMIDQDQAAHIVNTASEAAFAARGFVSAYHASKHAVLAITESLAQELDFLGVDIRVSVLCPGAINTALMQEERSVDSAYGQRLWQVYLKSLERGMSAEDVARCVVDGVRAGRFYLLPHPEVVDLPGERAQAVKHDEYPKFAANLGRLILEDRQ